MWWPCGKANMAMQNPVESPWTDDCPCTRGQFSATSCTAGGVQHGLKQQMRGGIWGWAQAIWIYLAQWLPMVSHGLPWSPMVSLVSGMISLVATKIGSKSSCEPASKHSEPGCSCELCVIFSFPTQLIQPSSTIHMMWHRIVGVVWAFWCLRFSVKNLLPSRLNADVCARYDFDNEQIGQGLVPVWRSKMVSQNFQRDHIWCSADYASCLLNLCPSFPCDSIAIPEDYRIHRVILPRILQPKMHQNAGKLDTWNAKKHQQMICAIDVHRFPFFLFFFRGGARNIQE